MRLPAGALLALIGLYQRTVSPLLPIVTVGACSCRFAPTCSHYAAEAIRVHGAARGSWLALRRLVKCTPLHPGGIDPVPAPNGGQRRAVAASFACFSVARDSRDSLRRSSRGHATP